jgi:hypothetical protein
VPRGQHSDGSGGGTPRARLYLDLDGVLAPYARAGAGPSAFADLREVHTGRLERQVSPRLLRALLALPAELVWCTSWGGYADELLVAATGVGGRRRALALGAAPQQHDGWKLDAVLTDVARDPRPFVWADDRDVDDRAREVCSGLAVPCLLLAPVTRVGLTPTDLAAIEAFVNAPARPPRAGPA